MASSDCVEDQRGLPLWPFINFVTIDRRLSDGGMLSKIVGIRESHAVRSGRLFDLWKLAVVMAQIESSGSQRSHVAGDDAFTDVSDLVMSSSNGCVVQMFRLLLETCESQRGRSHFGNAMSRDAEHLAFEGHDICEKGYVPDVDLHAMRFHCGVDLIDDGLARRLNSQYLFNFHDVIRLGLRVVHS